jgi:hypothetical protein
VYHNYINMTSPHTNKVPTLEDSLDTSTATLNVRRVTGCPPAVSGFNLAGDGLFSNSDEDDDSSGSQFDDEYSFEERSVSTGYSLQSD